MRYLWRKLFSSVTVMLWLLIIALSIGVGLIIFAWNLKVEQALSAVVAAAAVPLAFLSQRAILREDQRQKMRYEAYENILIPISALESVLASISVSDIKSRKNMIEYSQELRSALKDFTNTYHSHEMVFRPKNRLFKYLHFSFMKLTSQLDSVEHDQGNSYSGYGERIYSPSAKAKHTRAKQKAGDLASYLYDLKKELIEALGFGKVLGTVVEKRKPLDEKYKLLTEVATKKAVKKLEKSFGEE